MIVASVGLIFMWIGCVIMIFAGGFMAFKEASSMRDKMWPVFKTGIIIYFISAIVAGTAAVILTIFYAI